MAYSADLRNKALNYYEPCKNISQTAATFNLSRNTLYLWMRLEAESAAAALVLGAGVFLYVGGTEVDFLGLQRQIAPGKLTRSCRLCPTCSAEAAAAWAVCIRSVTRVPTATVRPFWV